jgi:hypothetical protein
MDRTGADRENVKKIVLWYGSGHAPTAFNPSFILSLETKIDMGNELSEMERSFLERLMDVHHIL